MKKIAYSDTCMINGGGCGKGLSFAGGAFAGWGLAGAIVGGVAAVSGIGLVAVAVVIGIYCS